MFQCGALYRQRIRCTIGRAAMFDSSAYRAVVPSCSGEQLHCSFAFYEPSGGILQKGIKAEPKNFWVGGTAIGGGAACVIHHRFPGKSGSVGAMADLRAEPRRADRFSRCFLVRQAGCALRSENRSRMLQSRIGRKVQPVHRQAVKIARFPVVKKSLSWLPIISKKFSMHRSTMSR